MTLGVWNAFLHSIINKHLHSTEQKKNIGLSLNSLKSRRGNRLRKQPIIIVQQCSDGEGTESWKNIHGSGKTALSD